MSSARPLAQWTDILHKSSALTFGAAYWDVDPLTSKAVIVEQPPALARRAAFVLVSPGYFELEETPNGLPTTALKMTRVGAKVFIHE